MDITAVLPTYNEKENIERLIRDILKNVKNAEIIVVDDNSPDKTWEIVQGFQKKSAGVRLIRRVNERGLASAISAGVRAAKTDAVVWMDCDNCMPPSLIPEMARWLDNGYDIVVGSRYVKGGKDKRSFKRVLTSRMINIFANIILDFKVRDYDSGFIAARRRIFDKVPIPEASYGEYCIEWLYTCGRMGFRIKEIPYTFTDRELGTSKTDADFYTLIKNGFNYSMRIIRLRFRK